MKWLGGVLGGFLSAWLLLACAHPAAAPRAARRTPEGAPRVPAGHGPAEIGGGVERIYVLPEPPDAPVLGSADAKVKLQVCSDFECPYCARLAPVIRELSENYGELLRISWRDCPLPTHRHALAAAEVGKEVYAQRGDAGFWQYHDRVFARQDALSEPVLIELARGVPGVDVDKVVTALHDGRHERAIKAELVALVESGAASEGIATPATFINGRLLSGAQPYRVFEDAVERALQEQPDARRQAVSDSEAAYPMATARHILVTYRGARGADATVARSKEEAHAMAISLRQRLAQGAAFDELAAAQSECPSAAQGGRLGRFTRGELEEQFEAALFSLRVGEVSEVVETPFGFHVIRRDP